MSRLLFAEFSRLFRGGIYKLCLLVSVGFAAFAVVMRWLEIRKNPEYYVNLGSEYTTAEGFLFLGGLYLTFVAATLIGIFVGTEYSDGTIRNKLAVGHKRENIYLSKLIVCAVADVLLVVSYMLVVFVMGSLLLDPITMSVKDVLCYALVSLTATIAYASILLFLTMSAQNKAIGSVICLLFTFVMLMATLTISQCLAASEYRHNTTYIDEETGEVVYEEGGKNPRYLTGTKREIYEFFDDFLPMSQVFQIIRACPDNLQIMAFYDLIIVLITSGVGLLIFRKKNLK